MIFNLNNIYIYYLDIIKKQLNNEWLNAYNL